MKGKNTQKMSELNISVVIMRENMLISGKIYTSGKNFTLLPAVTAGTNITSEKQKCVASSFSRCKCVLVISPDAPVDFVIFVDVRVF